MSLNHITLMGRLTRDPELRATRSGVSVASFTVAVDRDYTDGNGDRATDFIDCVAWRQGGEFVSKYFRKGSMIAVSGRLESRKWQDRDGNNRTSWEVNVDHSYFGEAKRPEEQRSTANPNVYADDYNDGYAGSEPAYETPQGYQTLGYGGGEDNPFVASPEQQGMFDDINSLPIPF